MEIIVTIMINIILLTVGVGFYTEATRLRKENNQRRQNLLDMIDYQHKLNDVNDIKEKTNESI